MHNPATDALPAFIVLRHLANAEPLRFDHAHFMALRSTTTARKNSLINGGREFCDRLAHFVDALPTSEARHARQRVACADWLSSSLSYIESQGMEIRP